MKNTDNNYPNWEAMLANQTDQQLVETYNHGVQLRVWGTARMKYKKTIARNKNSSYDF